MVILNVTWSVLSGFSTVGEYIPLGLVLQDRQYEVLRGGVGESASITLIDSYIIGYNIS